MQRSQEAVNYQGPVSPDQVGVYAVQVRDKDGDIAVAPQLLESLRAVQAGTLDVDEILYGS